MGVYMAPVPCRVKWSPAGCVTPRLCGIIGKTAAGRGAKHMTAGTATAEPLIDLSLADAQAVIALAESYKADLTARLGTAPKTDAVERDVLAGASPALQPLTAKIAGFSRAERAELVGLVWHGMDEYDSFAASRTFAIATADVGIPQYLAKKALTLPGLLRHALEKMGYRA
jgi:hypothetical protein